MQQSDDNENKLYQDYIRAQYKYYKYLETIRIPQFSKFVENKVVNPLYAGFPREFDYYKVEPQTFDINKENIKKLQLLFHPDKNVENLEEATKLFQLLDDLIKKSNFKTINEIAESKDPWSQGLSHLEENNVFTEMVNYCKITPTKAWFDPNQYDFAFKSIDEVTTIYHNKMKTMIEFIIAITKSKNDLIYNRNLQLETSLSSLNLDKLKENFDNVLCDYHEALRLSK